MSKHLIPRLRVYCLVSGIWACSIVLIQPAIVTAQHQIVCSGQAAGGYAALTFANLRTAIFTVSSILVTAMSPLQTLRPKGGRIMSLDPSVTCLKDGTLLL